MPRVRFEPMTPAFERTEAVIIVDSMITIDWIAEEVFVMVT
jgi:hypothetical protein